MISTAILASIILIINMFVILLYLPHALTDGMLPVIFASFLGAVIIFVIGSMISRMLRRKIKILESEVKIDFWSTIVEARFLISMAIALAVLVVVDMVTSGESGGLISMLVYCCLFVGFGIYFSKWHSENYVSILFAVLVILLSSIVNAIRFYIHPSSIEMLGPERGLFALRNLVGDSSLFPLAASFVWSAWRISFVLKTKTICCD